jgi:IS5 family transposase
MFATTTSFCEGRVDADSIYALLHRECHRLFPDRMFADLFCDVGRHSVPPMIVAVVMVLQRIEGCSDREAVERFTYDVRWKYAAGGLGFDHPGFVHTVLVDMRARLARSQEPNRIFEATLDAARRAGLVGRRRVLDSTPLYDAVATMDTVTLIRSAIRGLLGSCDRELQSELRGVLRREDDYQSAGKPVCDYDDPAAREALIDALAGDAHALLLALDGRELPDGLAQAAALLAAVVGQDLDEGEDGVFRIARRVAKDRIISTVDPDTRHGHKTSARSFDGYKGHVGVDPDSELITATTVTAANAGDAAAATDLLTEELPPAGEQPAEEPHAGEEPVEEPAEKPADSRQPITAQTDVNDQPLAVYGDAAYGAGELLDTLQRAGAEANCKVQPPVSHGGRFSKDAFTIDLHNATVSCPAGQTTPLRPHGDGRIAKFTQACAGCPLAERCTTAKDGRTIYVGPYEQQLARARARQADPDWKADYTATRPKVERKIAHLMRRRHGGRRARVRGKPKVTADFALLAAAVNLARLGVLGLTHQGGTWTVDTA